jgi:hypothetical protein
VNHHSAERPIILRSRRVRRGAVKRRQARYKGQAAVANQLVNTRLRAIEQERKIRETEELEVRLEALEGVLKGRKRA